MVANPRDNDTSYIHGIPMTDEVYRRSTGWKQERYTAEETVKLDQLDLELPLTSVYEGVF